LIYAPYIIADSTSGPSKEYTQFMDEYNEKHKYCLVCGSTGYSTTLTGYIINMDNKDSYEDRNRCICSNCGDIHSFHDRVSKQHLRKYKINEILNKIKNK